MRALEKKSILRRHFMHCRKEYLLLSRKREGVAPICGASQTAFPWEGGKKKKGSQFFFIILKKNRTIRSAGRRMTAPVEKDELEASRGDLPEKKEKTRLPILRSRLVNREKGGKTTVIKKWPRRKRLMALTKGFAGGWSRKGRRNLPKKKTKPEDQGP